MGKIGLVTVLYKCDDVLPGFFKSISLQQYSDYVLYLIDNSENPDTDQLIEHLAVKYPLTQYMHHKTGGNIGVAAGNNIGAGLAFDSGCSHIILLNNDIEFEQDYLFTRLMEQCDGGEKMIVPKVYYFDTRRVWMAGGYMDKWRALGVHYGYNKPDLPKYDQRKYISYAPTCFMMIAKEVYDRIGYTDEQYFAYYDDTDFVWRATKAGFKLLYEPLLHILHKVSSSTGGNSPFYVYYSNRNKIYFIRKNLRGIQRYFAFVYTFLSRVVFYLRFDKVRRRKLIQGIKDGFKIQVVSGKG
ncbi:MAG: glycosyltransferase family 2 protein [Calditrichaeota bacterium]|nr:glycosyltransferase family 2 protein [Calditrichota bacterium]